MTGCPSKKSSTSFDIKQTTDTSSDENSHQSNSNGNSSVYKKEEIINKEISAETVLKFEVNIPFNRYSSRIVKNTNHAYRVGIYDDNKIYYMPDYGYLGKDSFQVKFYDYNNNEKNITVNLNIIKPPLETNRDYTISYDCSDEHFGRAKNFDLAFYDNNLNLLDVLYDDYYISADSMYRIIPLSTLKSASSYTSYSFNLGNIPENVKKHNAKFRDNIDNIMKITCNYPNSFLGLIYPVDNSEKWYGTKPSPQGDRDIVFSRNDLYFHVSMLSELHHRVYLKSYISTSDKEASFKKANEFMEKIFPNSHYTAEKLHNFDMETKKWDGVDYSEKFENDNKKYYTIIETLAEELTDKSVTKVIKKIVDNYESYYLSEKKECKDKTICGTLFPEYTELITTNNKFENGLNSWIQNDNLVTPAVGKIEYNPTNNRVVIDYSSNRADGSNDASSLLDLYKIEYLNNNSIDNYFFKFSMSQIYGGADGGFAALLGWNSSGFAGVYICFNGETESLGCIAWSDHANKYDLAWGTTRHNISSNNRFYNIRLDNVVRRPVKTEPQDIDFIIDISNYLKRNLPEVYEQKNNIKSIEYGVFTTEFRSPDNGCYFCEAKIIAKEISLFKVKDN